MVNQYLDDYKQTLEDVVKAVNSEYTANIDKYSILLKSKLQNKKVLEELEKTISKAASELEQKQNELNAKIWSVKRDGNLH